MPTWDELSPTPPARQKPALSWDDLSPEPPQQRASTLSWDDLSPEPPTRQRSAAPPPATGRGGRSANQPSRAASTPDRTPASGRSGKTITEPRRETYNGEEIVDRPDRVGRVSSPMLDQIMGSGGGTAQDLVDRYNQEKITGSRTGSISAPRGPAPSVGSVARGLGTSFVQGAVQAKSGIEQASNDFLPLAPWETPEMRASHGRKLEQEGAAAGDKIAQSTPEFETDTARGLYGGAASLAQMAPGIAASVATGNPLPGIAAASVQTGAQAYDKYKQRGATPGEAALGATLEGTVEGVGEMLPMGTIVAKFGKTGAKKFLSEFFIQEMGTEQATTLAQDAIDTAIANPDKTWGDYLKERPDAAYQTALGVLVMSGALGTASAGANYAANRLDERGRIANRNPADTRTPPPGIRETAEQEAAIVTPEDEASPLDTGDIVAGRVEIAKAEAGSTADNALGAVGLPKVGTPVTIDYGDGTVEFGTMRDTFADETGAGVIIEREGGKTLREYNDTLTDAGVRITPRETAGGPEITVPVVAEPTPKVAAAPQQTAAPKATGPTSPSSNGAAVIKSIFGDKARVTSGYRGPDHPLSKKNPRSWHARSHAAVDVAPIPGMTFEQAKARIEAQGYSLIEAINEVGKGRTKHATGDHWHFVIGEKGAAGPAAAPGAGDGLASVPAPTPARDVEPLELAQPDFDSIDAGPIDNEWNKFADESGTLNVPRSDMPQIKSEHRGAMVNFLNARGIDHEEQTVAARDLKPTQAEFSPAKVQKAKDFTGGNRAILVSSDGHVVDGHHQWLAARDQGEDIRTIRLNAPIRDLLNVVPEFPSAEVDKGSTAPARPAESTVEAANTLAGGMPVAEAAAVARGDATPAPRSQVRVVKVDRGKSVAIIGATPDDLARITAGIPKAKKPLRRKDGAWVYNAKYAEQIRAVLAVDADTKAPDAPPAAASAPAPPAAITPDTPSPELQTQPDMLGGPEVSADEMTARQMAPAIAEAMDDERLDAADIDEALETIAERPDENDGYRALAAAVLRPDLTDIEARELARELTGLRAPIEAKPEQESPPQSKPGQKEKAQEPAPSQPVEPTDEASDQERDDRETPAGPIDDFGEKLVGARKDTWQSFRDRMADAKKEDVTAVPLSKSWPEPDYQQLLDSGADQYAVAAMRAMRDAIPTKPRSYGVVAWGKQVEALRDTAEKMIDDAGLAENFTKKLATEFSRSLRDLQGAIDLYMEFGHERSFKGITFGSHHYSLYRGEQNVTKWTVEQKQKATAFSNWPRELAVADTREEALAKFKKLLANGGLDKKPAVVRFDIYSRTGKPGFWIGKKVGKTTADLKWFETVKEARAFKVEHYDDLVAMLDSYKDIPPERKEVNSPRVGINHRNGADVTPDQFMETFGFRGVQFGNYVEGARRQEDLNEAYDALMDLAGVLGIPAKALSLNGTLGLAFGARGKGGKNAAMAHFEPGNIVINLTKKQGAGSLAHEWWHGLDNYFARQRGNGNFVTETTGRPAGEMRQEMADAFKAVMAAIKQTAIKERSRELDKRRTKDYWSTDIEMSARAFESYVIAKLQDEQFSNDYLANIVSEKAWAIEGAYPYPVASEIAAIRAGFDGFFQAIESKQDGERVPLYSLPRESDDLPLVATITSRDLGPLPTGGSRLKVLRDRAMSFYVRNFVGRTVTASDGKPVIFSKRSGRKSMAEKGDEILRAVPAIEALITKGRASSVPQKPGRNMVATMFAGIVEVDGERLRMGAIVREDANGRRHYDLTNAVRDMNAGDPEVTGGADPKNSLPGIEAAASEGINLFRLTDTRKADAGNNAAFDAGLARLQDELRALNLSNKVMLRLVDTMGGAQGSYLASLITIARDAEDGPIFTLNHEVIHALRDMGVFSPADWALLVAKAKRTPGMMRQINRRYLPVFRQQKMTAAQMEDALNEEAVADLFAMWQRGDYQAKGTIERLFQRLRGIVDAIKRFGKERERTADDVLREIADGTMGARAEAFTSGGARGQVRPTFGRKLSSPDLDMSTEARQARAIAQGFLTEAAWQEMKGGQGNVPEGRGTDGRLGYVGDTSSTAQKAGRDEGGVAEDQGLADADRSGLATFYHGTSDRIGAFALDHPNRKDNGWLGRGVYLTDDPALARMYAMQKRGDGDEQIMELHARLSNPYRATLATKQELRRASAEQVAKWTEDRIAEGHDGTILIYPDGTAELAVFDPANLREPDAAFDPEQSNSANLKFSLPDLAQSGPFKRDQAADDAAEASLGGISRLLNGNKRDDDKISAALNWLRVGFQDRMVPVLRLQEAVSRQLGSDVGEKMNPYLAEETMHGRIGARLDALMEDHVQPLVEAMASANVELIDFEDYIYARHAPERNAQIAKINPEMPDGGSGMTNMEARAVMKRIERAGMTETMESLAARYDAMMAEAKQRRIDAGLLSQEEADAWDEAYEFYAPLRGRAEVEGEFDPKADARMQRSSGLSVKGKESKRAFGRRTKAADILSYAVLQAEEAIVRSEQNRVGNAFLELAKTIGDGDLLTINKVERRRRINPTTGLVEFYTVNQLTAEDAPYTVSTKVDGTEHRITMNRANPQAVAIADAMRNLSAVRFELLVRTAGKLTRFFSAVNTRFSPPFIITNAIRDVMTAATTLQQYEDMPGLTRDVLRDWRKALVAGRRGDGEWAKWRREWELAGGKVAFNQMVDFEGMRERMHKDIARVRHPNDLKRIAGRFFEAVETVNDAIERAVRLSVYANARKRGVSKAKAASMSLNVTVNFTRKGQFGPAMNSAYAFFNASTQGSATLIFAAMRSKKVRRAMFGFVLLGFALDMINAMMAGDDDDGESYWDKMPEWEKSRNLILMLPGGDYIKLPLAYGLNALYGLGRNASAVGRGGMTAGEAVTGSMMEIADAFNPIGGGGTWKNIPSPTISDWAFDIDANKDFTGRPIQPEANPFASPETPSNNYFPSVSVPAKWLAQTLNDLTGGDEVLPGTISLSPEVLEYAFGYITGGAGRFVEDNVSLVTSPLDPEAELTVNDVPMVDRLTGTYPEWLDKSLYYDRAHETRDKLGHVKDYVDLGKEDKARAYLAQHPWLEDMAPIYKAAEKEMKRIRKDKREVNAAHELGELTDAQHREGLKIIKADEDYVVLQFNTAWNIVMDRQEQSDAD